MRNLYLELFSKHINITLFILISVFLFFSFHVKNFQLDASSDTLILDGDEDLKKYRDIVNTYSSKDFLILTLTDEEKIISNENINFIKKFTSEIIEFNWVDSVQSILNVPLLSVNNQSLSDLVNEILTITSPQISLDEAEKELLDSPIFKNLILSEDASSTGILVYFKRNQEYEDLVNTRNELKDKTKLNENEKSLKIFTEKKYQDIKKKNDVERHQNILDIRKLIQKYQNQKITIHLGGVSMIADDTITFVKNDIVTLYLCHL